MHSVMICECLASIELATAGRTDLRFISWGEILARTPDGTRASTMSFRLPASAGAIIPDGLFGLEYRSDAKRAYRFFALELDRGTMPVVRSKKGQTSLLGKFETYAEIIERRVHKSHLGIPNLLVLTVCMGPSRLEAALNELGRLGQYPAFLFKSVGHLTRPVAGLLAEPWLRSVLPPLSIANLH
jgi:hypothetical protein